MARGGYRPGSGRKPKVEEQALIEKLTPLEPIAFKALKDGLEKGERWAVKLFFDYMYGKPKEQKLDIQLREQPLFGGPD